MSMILDTLDTYLLIKALHLIFVITWFAGLFYIPRLFVYHIEALDKPAAAQAYIVPQLQLMTRRLWNIITWPSAILATAFALWLLYLQPIFLTQGWMHLKLFFVVLLWLYHLKCHQMVRELQRGQVRPRYTATFMRIWNEGATILPIRHHLPSDPPHHHRLDLWPRRPARPRPPPHARHKGLQKIPQKKRGGLTTSPFL